ncbi:VOC family protein [Algirhabdus cladophorae]|uniref:VOC family protein n=1 Tax=Algirhabdus cladophorae TaxID=3377108 RepID=UPI003B8492D2
MSKIIQITPFVFTRSLQTSLTFYKKALGFTCTFHADNYAFVQRNGKGLRVIEVDPDADCGEQMIYLDCDDVDAVYKQLKPQLDLLPKGRVRAPFDQPYAQREFHVHDPDFCLLLFGTAISPSTS